MAGSWFDNSLASFQNTQDYNTQVSLLLIAVAVLILAHSAWLHRTNLKRVRIINDVICLAVIGTAISIYYCKYRTTHDSIVI
jgi:uncharacterized membrane protein YGL010W